MSKLRRLMTEHRFEGRLPLAYRNKEFMDSPERVRCAFCQRISYIRCRTFARRRFTIRSFSSVPRGCTRWADWAAITMKRANWRGGSRNGPTGLTYRAPLRGVQRRRSRDYGGRQPRRHRTPVARPSGSISVCRWSSVPNPFITPHSTSNFITSSCANSGSPTWPKPWSYFRRIRHPG